MVVLYFIVIKIYIALIFIASIFNKKAQLWVKGRSNWKSKVRAALQPGEKRIHFHCASLGEFEQGKPLLEELRKFLPEHKFFLTFYSPSGYELKKNEPLADYVFYLPSDGPLNARKFIDLVQPEMAFFVKYEFWHFFITEYRNRKIPIYFVSSIFRPTQLFFQPGFGFFFSMLKRVSHFFVQNQSSLELLYKHGITQVSVTGDTRFDRVIQNSLQAKELPELTHFKGDKKLLVAGSTWKADEKILRSLIYDVKKDFKIVIAPHETGSSRITKLMTELGDEAIRYSEWDKKSTTHHILVIDNVGMLSSVYRYADVAYIGGGFGSGIHNVLEAVVFGIPVFFGPKYKKFREASELVHWKGAFSIKSENELKDRFLDVMYSDERIEKIKEINKNYIDNNKGSTELIINFLRVN